MATPHLRLRGHHVTEFAFRYLDARYDPSAHDKCYHPPFRRRLMRVEGAEVVAYDCSQTWPDEEGHPMTVVVQKTWLSIKSNPELKIRVVAGLDNICGHPPNCSYYRPNKCASKGGDLSDIREYGLVPNKEYSARELVDAVTGFAVRTGFRSPLDRRTAENK